jgi:hypothetical protein
MSVAAFCRVVQSQWQAFTEYVWPPPPEQRLQAELARRTADLARRYRRLVRRRRKIEVLRDRLARQERELAEQPSPFPEPLLHARERSRQRLAEHEARYARQRQEYLSHKQLRLALLRGQVVLCDEPAAVEA